MNLFLSASMKFALFALLTIVFAGCTHTLYNHRTDFTRTKPNGAWHDYKNAVNKGQQPESPKERK